MEEKVLFLLNKIKTNKNNPIYRFGDIFFHKGDHWKNCIKTILKDDIYKKSILRKFIEKSPNKHLQRPQPPINRFNLLINIIEEKAIEYNITLPTEDEVVIHLRLGDANGNKNFLKRNYEFLIQKLINKYKIKKVTFCTIFNYGNHGCFKFSEKDNEINKKGIIELFTRLLKKFKNINFDVVSNLNSDYDLIYMFKSKYFIEDFRRFSKLIKNIRSIKKKISL